MSESAINKTFAQYTSSVAFALQLSKRQCNALLRLDEKTKAIWHGSNLTTYKALEAKGLVYWGGIDQGFRGLTEAGTTLCQLLRIAGLTIENTETAVTLRELRRAA